MPEVSPSHVLVIDDPGLSYMLFLLGTVKIFSTTRQLENHFARIIW